MRHFKKIDWSVSLSLLFACVLTVVAACVESAGPLGAPNLVEGPTVSSVQITLAQSALAPGQTTQATAVAKSADGKIVAGRVDFSSQNLSIATVSSSGVVRALTAGVVMIQATVANVAASASVTVRPLVTPVAVVAVALDSTSLAIGHFARASATAKDSAGNVITGQTVTWASLSPPVATVSSTGTVTAVSAGSATIRGTVSGKSGSASLTVIQVPASPVSVVAVQVDSTTLLVGHVAHASATAKDAMGNVITGQVVTWASLTPGIATVSSSGAVTAVAPGPAIIQASVSGVTGLDTLVVVAPLDLLFANFDDGTLGSYVNVLGFNVDFIDDPTGSARGKVARIHYDPQGAINTARSPGAGFSPPVTAPWVYRYGRTLWMKGDFYLPSTMSDGVTPLSAYQQDLNRKLIDYQGTGKSRMTLHRVLVGGRRHLKMSIVDYMNGSEQEVMDPDTGIEILSDTWYTIEVKIITNSADNVRDGVVEIYMNGAATPTFQQTTGLGWITEAYPGGSDFHWWEMGFQLSLQAGDAYFDEYRYWDNVGFSTSRIGR